MTIVPRSNLEAVYREHPLRKSTILRRVIAQHGSLSNLTAWDLADDARGGITDQNHVGGARFTIALAEACAIDGATEIVDLCCGLAGAARVLAALHGCRVHGIDLSPDRVRDAEDLTRLVNLSHLITVERADVMTVPVPPHRYDVMWGQGAWIHLRDKEGFVRRWTGSLRPGGRVGLEDAYLKRPPATASECALVADVEAHWLSDLVALDGPGSWTTIFTACGFEPRSVVDLSDDLGSELTNLIETASASDHQAATAFEQDGWRAALAATECGLVGYFRTVAYL